MKAPHLTAVLGGFIWLLAAAGDAAVAQPVGYSGPRIQLHPIMVPYRTPAGIYYAPVTIRLVLSEGTEKDASARQRTACFVTPLIHERFLFYLHGSGLREGDLSGRNAEVIAAQLHKVAQRSGGAGVVAGVEFVEITSPPLSPTSRTLSTQCR